MARFAALVFPVACVLAACAAPTPVASPDPVLYLENRGGPQFTVSIGAVVVATVSCGSGAALRPGQENVPALPWDLTIVRVHDGRTLVAARVAELPRWFVQLGDEPGGGGLSEMPVLGPVITCPPSEAEPSVPPDGQSPTPTPNRGAAMPSNACGGFHLRIVNDRPAAVRVTLNGERSTVVEAQSTETLVQFFLPEPPLLPWEVEITDEATGQQLFTSTMPGPVDQKVTLSDDGAVQAPFEFMTEDC